MPMIDCPIDSRPIGKTFSTETALLRLFDDLRRVADRKVATALLFLDLSAAFDTIDHRRLLDRIT
jgi:hypothetical protein